MMSTQAVGAQDPVKVRKCAAFCLGAGTVTANTCGMQVALLGTCHAAGKNWV